MTTIEQNREIRYNQQPPVHSHGANRLHDSMELSSQSKRDRLPQPSEGVLASKEIRPEDITRKLYWLTASNPKTLRSVQRGWLTLVIHLAPATYSGHKVCKNFTQCATTCLFHQGRGRFPQVKAARIRKTQRLIEYPEQSVNEISAELCYLLERCKGKDAPKICVRLNCLSDIPWEHNKYDCLGGKNIFDAYPNVQFYDYTKWKWGTRDAWVNRPLNYHLTYSFDGTPEDIPHCKEVLSHGDNVAVTLQKAEYKKFTERMTNGRVECAGDWSSWASRWGYPCADGDANDLRFLDPSPVVLMGREKGSSNIAIKHNENL